MANRWRILAWRGLAALAPACALPAPVAAQAKLFRSDSVLAVTLRSDFRDLRRDRDTSRAVWRTATISYQDSGAPGGPGGPVTVPLRLRTRGIFRREHCSMPPIRMHIGDAPPGALFRKGESLKLVVPCRAGRGYEQLVLQEYAVYRILRLLSPGSLAARLLRVTWEDESGRIEPTTSYAFVTEEPLHLSERLHGSLLGAGHWQRELTSWNAALLGTFEYFIGNTDWSMPGGHNIAVIRADGTTWAVPFDFDFSGAVDAPYAFTSPTLPIRSVRERLWRGRCMRASELEPVLEVFEAQRDTIAALYRAVPDLEPRRVERTLRWFDEFYRAIADRAGFARSVLRDCRA